MKSAVYVLFFSVLVAVLLAGIYYLVRIRPSKVLPRQINHRSEVLSARRMSLLEIGLAIEAVENENDYEKVRVLVETELEEIGRSYKTFTGHKRVFSKFDEKVVAVLDEERDHLENVRQYDDTKKEDRLNKMLSIISDYRELENKLGEGMDLILREEL